ncbi:MAG: penicillin-binding transpeptidase domain-containing protein, partial [Acidimicrobiales bacterium]
VTVPAPRGLIVDSSGTVLVGNQVQNELVLSRVEATQHPEIIGKLAALIRKPAITIRRDITNPKYSPYQPVPILDPATAAVVQYVDAHPSEYPGVTVQQVTQRYYPQGGTTAAQTLGYVGPITATALKTHPGYSQSSQIGKSGIEQEYEKYLRGAHGRQALSVDATGKVVGTLTQKAPSQGDTLQLHDNLGLQKALQAALANDITADRHRTTSQTGLTPAAPNGAAVVMDARTGAVLATASYPTYKLTTWVGGISTSAYQALTVGCNKTTGGCPLNNYAIQGLYAPGSTFKLATATAALHDGLISPYSTADDTGIFSMKAHGYPTCTGNCTFHDATAADAGVVNVTSAITKSDDFFFYTLGVRFYHTSGKYGVNAIQDAAHQLGLGTTTGIDLPNEVKGHIDGKTERQKLHQATPTGFPNTYWYPATSLEVAFGQGATVITPIEQAQAYATFADHGIRHQPEMASDILSPGGKVLHKIAPKVTGKVPYATANWSAMLQGFVGAVNTPHGTAYGTFKSISKVPSSYIIAGKTGTATTATKTGRPPNAWFVGFGPTNAAPGQPEYVVAVAVAQGGYGSTGAAPAVATVFNYLYANPVSSTSTPPTATQQPSTTPPPANPPAGTPTTTTTAPPATTTAPSTTPSTTTTTSTKAAKATKPATPTATTRPTGTATPTNGVTTAAGGTAPTAAVQLAATGASRPPGGSSGARSPP